MLQNLVILMSFSCLEEGIFSVNCCKDGGHFFYSGLILKNSLKVSGFKKNDNSFDHYSARCIKSCSVGYAVRCVAFFLTQKKALHYFSYLFWLSLHLRLYFIFIYLFILRTVFAPGPWWEVVIACTYTKDIIWASLFSLLTPHQDNDTWKCFLLAIPPAF